MTSPSALCPGEVIGVRIHTSKAPPTKGLAPRNCPNYSFVVFDNPNAVNQVMQDMVSSNCLLVLLLAYGRFQDVQLGYLVPIQSVYRGCCRQSWCRVQLQLEESSLLGSSSRLFPRNDAHQGTQCVSPRRVRVRA